MSLGGYLAARAAAFEHRFKATVLFGGVWDFAASVRAAIPKEALAAYEAGDRAACERITAEALNSSTAMRWMVERGVWSYQATGLADYLDKLKDYTVEPVVDRIKCPCLVMDAEGDQFFRSQPQKVYDALDAPKRLVRFGQEDGAENHCQAGALAYKDQVVFDWLDETLDRRE